MRIDGLKSVRTMREEILTHIGAEKTSNTVAVFNREELEKLHTFVVTRDAQPKLPPVHAPSHVTSGFANTTASSFPAHQ
jgi:hypothetical protein